MIVVADSWRNACWRPGRWRVVSSRRASEHQCWSKAKITSLWHNFNISGCTYGCTFTKISVSACDPRSSSTVALLCLLLFWAVYWVELLFPCLLLRGAAWPPPLGAVAFFLFFSMVLPSFPSFGSFFPSLQLGCCLASSFCGSWCFATQHDGLGVGVLGCWVGCWGVRWFGG